MDLRSKLKPPTEFIHSIREELIGVLIFVGIVWGVFVFDCVLYGIWDVKLAQWLGLIPRTFTRLPGIVAMPFLHGDLKHIFSNTCPLLVLMWLLAGSRAQSWRIVAMICLLGGSILWVFGSPMVFLKGLVSSNNEVQAHVGASLLVFGLITFLISSGYFERRPVPVLIAVFVAILYGTTLIWGIIPKMTGHVSWDGHLSGGIAGVIVAYWPGQVPSIFRREKETGQSIWHGSGAVAQHRQALSIRGRADKDRDPYF